MQIFLEKVLVAVIMILGINHNLIGQESSDTITIVVDHKEYKNRWTMPYREANSASNPNVPKGTLGGIFVSWDSIRIADQVILKDNQFYYLIVIDSKGYKKFEGEFYDEFPCGKFISYQLKNEIESIGSYKLISPEKKQWSYRSIKPKKFTYKEYYPIKVGEWDYYNFKGDLLKTKIHNKKKLKNEKKNRE